MDEPTRQLRLPEIPQAAPVPAPPVPSVPAPPAPAAPAPVVPPRPAHPPRPPFVPASRTPADAGVLPPLPGHPAPFPSWPGAPSGTAETTTRLRPVPARHPGRTALAVACVVLGLGLIGGAATGSWLTGDSAADSAASDGFTTARTLWHSVPVDTLFPRTLKGEGAGPGGADRTWTRVAVAPDSGCAGTLDTLLLDTLRQAGCARVVRATYADATSSSVTTVGLVFTQADPAAMKALRTRFQDENLTGRADLMPRTFPVPGTVAAGFGDRQRASWTVHVLDQEPVVVYAVSGFADARAVPDPQPAAKAMTGGATTAAAQAGLGFEAEGVADRIEHGLREEISTDTVTSP
ncbi:hypothetical protein [Streptomyces sp. NPDC088725]|uniref:hypothetical protein n=1 Tax=Streptomyces sp. NPDC088725 TaxID=3365873 RepID=UPI003817BF31